MVTATSCAAIDCAGRPLTKAYQQPEALALAKMVSRGNTEDIQSFVRNGVDPNYIEDGAVPLLMWAMCADRVSSFKALLDAGADPNMIGNGHGLGSGKGHGNIEDGSIIYEGWSATVAAAASGQPDFLRLALQHGGDLDASKGVRSNGRPLLQAAYNGLFSNVKILVAAGADVNVHHVKYSGNTAPELALVRGRYDIALWLLEHGYMHDLQALARTAETSHVPLHSEQQSWKEKLIDDLQRRGAVFPATFLVKRGLQEREISSVHIKGLIYGRESVYDFPLRAVERN